MVEFKDDVKKAFDDLKVGDVLVGYYSYNVCLIHFYKVVGKTAASVKLQKLSKNSSGPQWAMECVPIMNSYDGKPITRRPSKYGYMYEDGKYSFMIDIRSKYNPNKTYSENLMD